jgi:hypothetical protein
MEQTDRASEILKKLGFSDDEFNKVKIIVKGIYDSLRWRKINDLFPLKKAEQEPKLNELLRKEIDDYRYLSIYCYNKFAEQMRLLYRDKTTDTPSAKRMIQFKNFSQPIEGVLEKDEFYRRLLAKEKESPLSLNDRIQLLQKKVNKSFMATKLLYADVNGKIQETCERVIGIVGDQDPQKLSVIMRFVFNTVHIAETDAIESIHDNLTKSTANDPPKEEDVCDANVYLGIDWSFLGILKKLPGKCNTTFISIVDPVKIGGRRTRKR